MARAKAQRRGLQRSFLRPQLPVLYRFDLIKRHKNRITKRRKVELQFEANFIGYDFCLTGAKQMCAKGLAPMEHILNYP